MLVEVVLLTFSKTWLMSPRQISFGAAVLSYVWNIMWVAFYVTVGLIKHALWLTTRTKKLLLTNHFVSWMKTSDRQSHLHFVLVSAASQRPRSATLRIRCDCGGLDEHVELSFERVFSKKRGTGCTHEYKWASTRRALFFWTWKYINISWISSVMSQTVIIFI